MSKRSVPPAQRGGGERRTAYPSPSFVFRALLTPHAYSASPLCSRFSSCSCASVGRVTTRSNPVSDVVPSARNRRPSSTPSASVSFHTPRPPFTDRIGSVMRLDPCSCSLKCDYH
eukprot:623780-Prymnesium_polylepis.1